MGIYFGVLIVLFILYEYYENYCIDVDQYKVYIDNLSEDFPGLKIAQISDVHLEKSKRYIDKIIKEVKSENVDVIFMTGDLVDSSCDLDDCNLDYLSKGLSNVASCYAISGNHETAINYKKWKKILEDNEVIVLDGDAIIYEKDNESFVFLGIRDGKQIHKEMYNKAGSLGVMPVLALAHRAEYFETYFKYNNILTPNVVFSGHAHGGQFRIPIINRGVYSPGEGLFPKYTSGIYEHENDGVMVVSRGLGNSSFPIRLFNRVNIPIVTIYPSKSSN